MDPNAALRAIDKADRVDAETREVMQGLREWLARGGFAPDWRMYPKGTRRYKQWSTRKSHATMSQATIRVGDIVRRADVRGKNRYVVVRVREPWIYTQRISGSGGPGIITFPSESMLRKVGSHGE